MLVVATTASHSSSSKSASTFWCLTCQVKNLGCVTQSSQDEAQKLLEDKLEVVLLCLFYLMWFAIVNQPSCSSLGTPERSLPNQHDHKEENNNLVCTASTNSSNSASLDLAEDQDVITPLCLIITTVQLSSITARKGRQQLRNAALI